MIEEDLQTSVQNYLTDNGVDWVHIPKKLGKKRKQIAGFFDLLCIGFNKVFFLELKSPDRKPRNWDIKKSQIRFKQILDKNKIPYIISNNYNQIIRFVERIKNGL